MIELADVVSQLGSELRRALWASESSDVRFSISQVELDLAVQVELDGASGRVRFYVLAGGSNAKPVSETQRIKLMLDLEHVDVHRSALISGEAESNEI